MLRPATPLTVFLGVAFVLLLLSVLSTPVIQAIPLGSYKDATFGVFGYCESNDCSSIGLGYGDVGKIIPGDPQAFHFSDGIRNTLSTILVLHPVAAGLTLIAFLMAAAAHLHSMSHSSRYMLIIFLLLTIDFLVCTAAFVVDLLLFLPHQAWGTYIVLAAAILIFLSGAGSCAMRRNLRSRKAFKKRQAGIAQGSDENHFSNQDIEPKPTFTAFSEPTMPVVSGANGSPDTLPAFTTFDHLKRDDRMSDEQIPLTMRTTSERSHPSTYRLADDTSSSGTVGIALGGRSRFASQDSYGSHVNGTTDPYAPARHSPYQNTNRGGRRSTDPPGAYGFYNGSGDAPQYMRGRGGYGPRGGRGGYGTPPIRGAHGPSSMARGGARSPPPGHHGTTGPYGKRPYAERPLVHQSPPKPAGRYGGYTAYNPDFGLPRAESPPPLPSGAMGPIASQSMTPPIEMDATPAAASSSTPSFGQIGESDTDVAGMVGLQQGRIAGRSEPIAAAESLYSEDQYVPARAAWDQAPQRGPHQGGSSIHGPHEAIQYRSEGSLPAGSANGGHYLENTEPQFDRSHNSSNNVNQTYQPQPQHMVVEYEGMRDRSPAESDQSNFTSISQRGVNPQWSPHPPMPQPPYGPSSRQPVQQRHDILLDNPDFQVPSANIGASASRGVGGMTPGSAYPTGPL